MERWKKNIQIGKTKQMVKLITEPFCEIVGKKLIPNGNRDVLDFKINNSFE